MHLMHFNFADGMSPNNTVWRLRELNVLSKLCKLATLPERNAVGDGVYILR